MVRVGLVGNPLVEVRGPVTCLTVTGNHAVIGMENSLGLPLVGPAAFVEVTDGGTSDSHQGDCVSFVATGGKNPPGTSAG